VTAYVYASGPNGYALQKAELSNLDSLRELQGRDIRLRRGTGLYQGLDSASLNRGSPFSLEYTLDPEGTVVPSDLHSLYGLSVYRGLDRVATVLREHGHQPRQPLDVYYFPRLDSVIAGDVRGLITDNAAYSPQGPFFMVVPAFMLSDLPLHLNEGVLAHEFGHSVVQDIVFGDALGDRGHDYDSMNEGVADLIGFAMSGDSNFLEASFPGAERDLAEPHDYTLEEYGKLEDGAYDPHEHGSYMARAVYELWPKTDGEMSEAQRGQLLDAVLASLRALKESGGPFWMGEFATAMVEQLPPDQRPAACQTLRARVAPLLIGDSPCTR
jgi:hypothetical protein